MHPDNALTYHNQVFVVATDQVQDAVTFYRELFNAVEVGRQYDVDGLIRVHLNLIGTGSTIIVTNPLGHLFSRDTNVGINNAVIQVNDVRASVEYAQTLGVSQVSGVEGKMRDKFGFSWIFSSRQGETCDRCGNPSHVPATCTDSMWYVDCRSNVITTQLVTQDPEFQRFNETVATYQMMSSRLIDVPHLHPNDPFHVHCHILVNEMKRGLQLLQWVEVVLYRNSKGNTCTNSPETTTLLRRMNRSIHSLNNFLYNVTPSNDENWRKSFKDNRKEFADALRQLLKLVNRIYRFKIHDPLLSRDVSDAERYSIDLMKPIVDMEIQGWRKMNPDYC